MTKTRKFRPVLAGTEVSRIIDALRAVQGGDALRSHTSIMARDLADRLTIEWADWLDKTALKAVKS